VIEKTNLLPIARTGPALGKVNAEGPGADEVSKQFGQFLSDALNKVNQQQQESSQLTQQFAAGQTSDVHQVLIASEKAALALELTVQIRNKVIEAYQEIMRTQI
jgi:flagellar hook-basal body complex protein FliE